jgi:hypothetical protein
MYLVIIGVFKAPKQFEHLRNQLTCTSPLYFLLKPRFLFEFLLEFMWEVSPSREEVARAAGVDVDRGRILLFFGGVTPSAPEFISLIFPLRYSTRSKNKGKKK